MAAVELPGLPREHLMRLAARSTLPLAPDGDNAAKVAAQGYRALVPDLYRGKVRP